MEKTIYFMAGLPRSGSSLLAAILNQNERIYASPQTDLLGMMYLLDQQIPTFESYVSGVNHEGYHSVLGSLGQTFYAEVEKPVVIDKNRAWGTPYNLNLAALLNPDVRIVATVRPILEVLASFVVMARANPETNFIDRRMLEMDFYALGYRSLDDARCDWLMRPNGELDLAIISTANSRLRPELFHLVTYRQLVESPDAVLGGIYDFLGEPHWQHDFSNVVAVDRLDDLAAFGIPDVHTVRPTIERRSTRPEAVLSDYVMNKYGGSDVVDV